MNIIIAGVTLKLTPEHVKYWPKNIRSFPLAVTINGNPNGEFRLTTGRGRDGEMRRYAHVMVEGKPYWAKLTDDVMLIEPVAKTITKVEPVAEAIEEAIEA